MWLLPLEAHSGVREAPRRGWAEPWPWAWISCSSSLQLWAHSWEITVGDRAACVDSTLLHILRQGCWTVLWGTLGDHQFLKTKRAYLGHVPKINISAPGRDRRKGKMARAIRHAPGRVVPESCPLHRQPLCDIQPHLAPPRNTGTPLVKRDRTAQGGY